MSRGRKEKDEQGRAGRGGNDDRVPESEQRCSDGLMLRRTLPCGDKEDERVAGVVVCLLGV
ncbi:hypothetical protein E2C01_008077 [Portunus trituberculatus]|uniref:Uncharacterized protein n=1 Tax=Portunus trituberculatus TaxID=210409 RepID=A0A5B7D0N6_PORTR|nr:hypothetical protein [Portunus trituberculatus]